MAPQTFQLVMRTGPTPGKTYSLGTPEITVGRDISNEIVIGDAEISRKHVRLTLQSGGYTVEDMGSTNGTFVNGQRLMGPHLLRPGELILLGENVSLAYEVSAFDQDATIAASNVADLPVTPTPAPQPARPAQPAYHPAPPPAYPPEYSAGPAQAYALPEEPRSNSRTWLYVGCGCLLIVLCVLIAGAVAFDQLNLYCSSPFRAIFACP